MDDFFQGQFVQESSSMFRNNDQEFAEIAADPVRRAAAIADLAGRWRTVSRCAGFASVAMIVATIANPQGSGVLAGCVAITWAIAFKFDTDLRLLRVVDRLHRGSGLPAAITSLEPAPGEHEGVLDPMSPATAPRHPS